MGVKLPKNTVPSGHTKEDFECFGPPALKDGEFSGIKICDMGCFTQDGKDSNKYYNACVTRSRKDQKWYAYFEWGRTGAKKVSFQFVDCADESDAQKEFEKQCHSKNDKRGEWVTIAGIRTLRAKKNKDCYLVRPQATRSTGLPNARTIKSSDGADTSKVKKKTTKKTSARHKKSSPKADPQTLSLMKDLNVATVQYTKGAMADSSLPTQSAIDEGRQVLTEAERRLLKVGDDLETQRKDKQLSQLTRLLYSRIPKVKPVGAAASTWILSKDNIMGWKSDLDAFESALYSVTDAEEIDADPFGGMPLTMNWIDVKGSLGSWLARWASRATLNRHGWVGDMKVHNIWKVERHGDEKRFYTCQDRVAAEKNRRWSKEKALFQNDKRPEFDKTRTKAYKDSNTALLFHGTRSVNVSGILRKSLLMPRQLVGVVITGAMFGPGLYFADDWKKSAGYTSLSGSYWSGGSGSVRGRHAFMFLVDTVLGNPHVASGPSGYTSAPRGHHCVFGKAGHSHVQNNEWIVYKTEQHILRYLVEFSA